MNQIGPNLKKVLDKRDESLKGFLVKIYKYLKINDPDYSDIDYYEKAEREKGNFSNALKGLRPLNKDYYIPIEKVLGITLADLASDNIDKPRFPNRGIRYVASLDDYNEYLGLFEEKTDDGGEVWKNYDEYDNNLLSYILLYQSGEGLRALHEKKGAAVNFFDMKSLSGVNGFQKETEGVLHLICLKDSAELFKSYFDIYRAFIECRFAKNWLGILEKEENMDLILSSDEVLKGILESREFKEESLNPHMVSKSGLTAPLANPYIHHLLRHCLNHADVYLDQAKRIVRYAIGYNEKAKRYFNANPGFAHCHVQEDGSVLKGIGLCGNLITYKIETNNGFDAEFDGLLKRLDDSLSQIKFADKPITGGASRKEVRIENGRIVKSSSGNEIEYQFLKNIEPFNLPFIPRLLEKGDEYDAFSFVEGRSLPYDYSLSLPLEAIKEVMEAIKEKDEASKAILGNGKVYVHGDLSPRNIIFHNNRLSGFIDWDTTHIGFDYEDLCYTLWQLLNIGNPNRNSESLYARFVQAVSFYKPSSELRKGFVGKMLKVMGKALESTKPDDPNYQRIFEWVGWSKIWVSLYKERISEDIG